MIQGQGKLPNGQAKKEIGQPKVQNPPNPSQVIKQKIKRQSKKKQSVDEQRFFFIKYIIIFFVFIIFGSIIAERRQESLQKQNFNIQSLTVKSYSHQQKPQSVQLTIESNKSFPMSVQKQYKPVQIQPQPIKPSHKFVKPQPQSKEPKIISVRTIEQQKTSRTSETPQTSQTSQNLHNSQASRTLRAPQTPQTLNNSQTSQTIEPSKKVIDTLQKEFSKQEQKPQVNNSIANSTTQQTKLSDFVQTYQDNQSKITETKENLPVNNTKPIKQIKKQQIIKKQPTYRDFKTKIWQVSNKRNVMYPLKLYPYLQDQYTTPIKISKFNKIKYQLSRAFFGSLIYRGTQLWDDLFKVCKSGGYWLSKGNLLTVASSTVINKGDHLLPLKPFVPTQIKLTFPYDIPSDQSFTIYGVKISYDSQQKVQKKSRLIFLGHFDIQPTQQERMSKKPIQRVYFCEHRACRQYYSLIQIKSKKYNLYLHRIEISSGFSQDF